MRPLFVLAMSAAGSFAFGQVGALRSIDGLSNDSAKPQLPGVRTNQVTRNPLQPTGFTGLPSKHSDQAPEKPTKETKNQLKIIEAGHISPISKDEYEITGPVHCQAQGYDIYADYVKGNLKTKVYILKGNAKLVSDQGVVLGQYIEADLANEHYKTENSEADLRPSVVKGKAKDDIYLKGRRIEGDKKKVDVENGSMTTCNLDHPHFDIESAKVEITPYDEAILHRVRIVALGKTLIGIPRIAIPINEGADRYLPDVGESSEEGYFIKTRYGVDLGRKDGFDARLDYMTRLGAGIGGDYKYKTDKRKGKIQLYGVTGGKNYFEYVVSHNQLFGKNTFSLESSLQNKHYLNAPDSTTFSVRTYYRILQDKNSTQLSVYESNNETSTSSSTSRTIGLTDTRNIPSLFRSTLSLDWAASESHYGTASSTRREQVNVKLNATRDLVRANAILDYQRSIPVGETVNFLGAADKTPVLTLQSTDRKLFGKDFWLPFQSELSIGEFTDSSTKNQITRESFSFQFGNKQAGGFSSGFSSYSSYSNYSDSSLPLSSGSMNETTASPRANAMSTATSVGGQQPHFNPLSFTYNGRFKQGIYSNDTALYSTGANSVLAYRMSSGLSMNLRYNYMDSHGYTPLQIDRQGRSNTSTLDIDSRLGRNLTLAAGTGYDFFQDTQYGQSKWQAVNVRTEWTPSTWFQFRTNSTYDTSQEKLSNIRFDVGYKPGATYVGVGAKYDGIRHQWGNLSFFMDGLKIGRLKLSTLLIYNGYLKKFESRHFSFIYDLHCAEAVFQILDNPTGYRSGTQFVLMIRLKAFPTKTPFGTGSTGQSLGLGSGRGSY